jgi:7-cyano-7-deazaguanine synthase
LDSVVNLKLAQEGGEVVTALTFDYGQRAAWREVEAAGGACRTLKIPHEVVRLDWMADIAHSALVNAERPLPYMQEEALDDPQRTAASAREVWVPNRNGVFLGVGAAYAEARECDRVVVGFNKEEAASFPDNSAAFLDASNAALKHSVLRPLSVTSYTVDWNKEQIVRKGREIEAPLQLVWSCYEGGEVHCWRCESCLRLKRALERAGSWEWFQEQTGVETALAAG